MTAQLVASALGIWLMAAPSLVAYAGSVRASHLIVGPMVASVGIISAWEVTRGLRWVNAGAGVWLVASPLILTHAGPATIVSVGTGLAVLGLSLVRGRVRHRYGGGWRSLLPGARPPVA